MGLFVIAVFSPCRARDILQNLRSVLGAWIVLYNTHFLCTMFIVRGRTLIHGRTRAHTRTPSPPPPPLRDPQHSIELWSLSPQVALLDLRRRDHVLRDFGVP